jgi:ABC-type multidrug transport system ATPase subunit
MLRVEQVHKSYRDVRVLRGVDPDVRALRGVDLDVAAGEVLAVLGSNGAGKSTLLSVIAGLTRPSSGTVTTRGRVGLAPQELGIYPTLTVAENLRFFARLSGRWGARARSRVERVAEPLGLTPLLDRPARALSGGEQRRLHVAMALVDEPAVVLLDEPTAGVDVASRIALLDLVRDLARDGAAICYSTHYLAEAERLDGTTIVLDHGRVVARGTVKELIRAHGESRIDLTFTGPPPEVALPWPVRLRGDVLQIITDSPQAAAVHAINEMARGGHELRSVGIVSADLESVFVNVTAAARTGNG